MLFYIPGRQPSYIKFAQGFNFISIVGCSMVVSPVRMTPDWSTQGIMVVTGSMNNLFNYIELKDLQYGPSFNDFNMKNGEYRI